MLCAIKCNNNSYSFVRKRISMIDKNQFVRNNQNYLHIIINQNKLYIDI